MTNTIRDRLWRKAAKQQIPLTLAFELLPLCNLSCKMCYVRKSMQEVNARGGIISGKQWLQWAAEAKEKGLLFPLLTGGEPFLHPDFKEIYSGMCEMGMQVSINSNGTMIDEAWADWLANRPPTRINITLYGASAETYEALCDNKNAYEKMVHGVKLLKERNIPVKFNASITPYNVHELEEIMAFAKEMEYPLEIATYMFPPIRRDETMIGQNDRLSPEEAALARVKSDFIRQEPEWILGQAERYKRFVPIQQVLELTKGKEPVEQKMTCRAGNSSGWLNWEGELSGCGMYHTERFSLKEHTFADAWKQLTEHTAQLRYRSFCSICPNQWLCHACIAMVYNECGTVDGRPEYMCQMNEAAAKYYYEYASRIPNAKGFSNAVAQDFTHTCELDDF